MPDERGIVSKSKLTALATKIKTKAGASGTYTLDELVDVVDDIEGGGITPSGTISITENGTVDVTQYASAEVNVSGGGGESIAPYTAKVGTIGLASSGTITIPTPNIDTTQFFAVFFMLRDYAQTAQEQFSLGNKVNFGARYIAFNEYQTASGQANTKPQYLRYGVDNTALNYFSVVTLSASANALNFTNAYYQGIYDYVVIYKEKAVT